MYRRYTGHNPKHENTKVKKKKKERKIYIAYKQKHTHINNTMIIVYTYIPCKISDDYRF
jgi:hypothetical protein